MEEGAVAASRREAARRLCLTMLCCTVPLAATAAVVFLQAPAFVTALIGMLLLVPLGRAMLAEPPGVHDNTTRGRSPRMKLR